MPEWKRDLLCDPQTSGGLLVAVAPGAAAKVLDMLRAEGFEQAAQIGEIHDGLPGIDIV
jgi:selenide,water dikinase